MNEYVTEWTICSPSGKMKYVSFAIRTTGSNPGVHQIIEFVSIIDDLTGPIKALPRQHLYIDHQQMVWDPEFLRRHWKLLQKYLFSGRKLWSSLEVPQMTADWLQKEGVTAPLIIVGNGDDRPFLYNLPAWDKQVPMTDQFINPSALYFDPKKHTKLPEAYELLNTEPPPDAVSEAEIYIALIRRKWAELPTAGNGVSQDAEPNQG